MIFFENVFFQVILAALLGALIGSQREIIQQKKHIKDFAGFRTFTLVSILGFLMGYLSNQVFYNFYLVLIGIFGIFLIAIIAYKVTSNLYPKRISIISEISFIITFLIGFIISIGYLHLAITLTIFIAGILFLGTKLHKFTKQLKENEIFATLKFAIISLVILPILPNKNYTLLELPFIRDFFLNQNLISKDLLSQLDVFNFFYIWLMVVFISGIAFVGYILMRTIGSTKGIEITGLLGGLMSSTALTSAFAIESKKLNYLSTPLAVGIIIACSTMFFRILFEVLVLNPNLFAGLFLTMGVMGIVGYIGAFYTIKKIKLNHVKEMNVESPFTIGPAIKFSLLFLFVIFISKLFTIILGEKGIYLISFLSGISDVDTITISLSSLSKNGDISILTAQIGILIAAFANTIFKAGIAYYLGSKQLSKFVIISFIGILVFGIFSIIFLF